MNRDYVCLKKEDFKEEQRAKKNELFTKFSATFRIKTGSIDNWKKIIWSKKFSDSFTLIWK